MKGLFLSLLKLARSYYKYYMGHPVSLVDLIFFVTYKCNFRCHTCFYVPTMNNKTDCADKELTLEEIRKASSYIGILNKLLLSGGEPFLRDDLPEICRIFYLQNKVRNIHLPTNGFYPEKILSGTNRILEECPELKLTIGLPLDGLKETHDCLKELRVVLRK